MPKPFAIFNHPASDPAGADHAYRFSVEVEATQTGLREIAPPGPLRRLDEMAADCEQQRKNMLGNGDVAVIGHIADGYAMVAAIGQVDMVVACRARGDQPEVRQSRKNGSIELGIDERADNLCIRIRCHRLRGQRFARTDHPKFRLKPETGLLFPLLGFKDCYSHKASLRWPPYPLVGCFTLRRGSR